MGAETLWVGAAPGVWNSAGNWTLGAAPVDTNEAKFRAANTQSVLGSTETDVKLDLLRTDRHYPGMVASLASPLRIDAARVHHAGSGSMYFKSDYDDGGNPTEFTDEVIVDSPNMNMAAHLDGDRIEKISVLSGHVELAATLGTVSVPALVEITNTTGLGAEGARLTIHAKSGATTAVMVTDLTVQAGTVFSTGRISVVHMHSGRMFQDEEQIDTLHLYGGTCVYSSGTDLGTATLVNVYGGAVLDLGMTPVAKTITTINRFPGSIVIADPNLVTFGTDNNLGGTVWLTPDSMQAEAIRAA